MFFPSFKSISAAFISSVIAVLFIVPSAFILLITCAFPYFKIYSSYASPFCLSGSDMFSSYSVFFPSLSVTVIKLSPLGCKSSLSTKLSLKVI